MVPSVAFRESLKPMQRLEKPGIPEVWCRQIPDRKKTGIFWLIDIFSIYLRLLFFWFAAIFSFAVSTTGVVLVAGALLSVPAAAFASVASPLRLVPFLLPWSFMMNHSARNYLNIF
jgi:hypothetical protein